MSFLWEKSGTWRWVAMNSKHSKGFFLAFTSLCLMSSWALGEAVMRTTSLSQIQLDEETRQIRPHDDGKSEQGEVRSVFGGNPAQGDYRRSVLCSSSWGDSYWSTRCSCESWCSDKHACCFFTLRKHCCIFANWTRC